MSYSTNDFSNGRTEKKKNVTDYKKKLQKLPTTDNRVVAARRRVPVYRIRYRTAEPPPRVGTYHNGVAVGTYITGRSEVVSIFMNEVRVFIIIKYTQHGCARARVEQHNSNITCVAYTSKTRTFIQLDFNNRSRRHDRGRNLIARAVHSRQ